MKSKCVVLLAILGVLMSGCSTGVTQNQYESVVAERDDLKALLDSYNVNTKKQDEESADETKTDVLTDAEKEVAKPKLEETDYSKQLEITEYSYVNAINNTDYCMVVKNNSNETLKISANITAKSTDGSLIGAGTIEAVAVQSGYSVAMTRSFDGNDIDKFEYSITAALEDYYNPILSDVEMTISIADKKAIVSCTNNGEEAADYVQATALFFEDGKLIYTGGTSFSDSDYELKPGNTIVKEIKAFQIYDDVKVYLSGRR